MFLDNLQKIGVFIYFLFLYKQGVDMFGKRVGFLKFKADILDKETGKMV